MTNWGGVPGSVLKKVLIIGSILLVISAGVAWYLFSLEFKDTAVTKADYEVRAIDLLEEFKKNDSLANSKYTEKIIEVTGRVSAIEKADTSVNLKMTDSATGSYLIFAFQSKSLPDVKQIKEGEEVTIKGSCSGGLYSQILDARYISFKRCIIIRQ
jgi:hypothetical protein